MGCKPWNLCGRGRTASASQELSDMWFSSPVPFTHCHSHGLTMDSNGCARVLSCTGSVLDIFCRFGQRQDGASGLFSLLNSLPPPRRGAISRDLITCFCSAFFFLFLGAGAGGGEGKGILVSQRGQDVCLLSERPG